jgi:hypothetical protein
MGDILEFDGGARVRVIDSEHEHAGLEGTIPADATHATQIGLVLVELDEAPDTYLRPNQLETISESQD